MGGSLSKRFARNRQTSGPSGKSRPKDGEGASNRDPGKSFAKEGKNIVVQKRNYNAYSIGLREAKSEEVEDALLKEVMRTQLALDSQVFVLNQLLLGVHFFANYDVDIEKSKVRVRTAQNLKSEKIRHCNKSVMMTNELSEAIDQSVIFQMRHGPEKSIRRNLFNHKLYIVHDNVEIVGEGGDNMTYSSMNYQPSYRLEFDRAYKKRSGFVRLRFCDHVRITNPDVVEEVMSSDKNDSTETSNSTTSQTMSSLLYQSEDVRVIKERGIYNHSSTSTSSDYDYTYMASFNEHRPLMGTSNYHLKSTRITDPLVASVIPDECVTEIKRMITVSTVDEPEAESLPSDNLEYRFQYMEQRGQYLNAKMFMNHFKRIFRDQISANLEIGTDQLMNATWKGASIYCPVQGSCGKQVNHYEIIPAIACPWPSEAMDWFQRKRVLAAAVQNSESAAWLTEEMISRIVELNCHAIPIGYVSKKSQRANNFNRSLEWKIIFPDAERYLESRLTDCQLRVYILAKILYKTYIEPLNIPMSSRAAAANVAAQSSSMGMMTMSLPDLTSNGGVGGGEGKEQQQQQQQLGSHFNFITDEHLRAHLFMQCELNAIEWSELNLGGNLMEFLRTFLHRVQTKNLPDFFLPKRNLLEHVPENVITRLHENIFRILENPVMFVMQALKNVRFVKGFYPKVNIKRLYGILTIAEPIGLVNPKLRAEETDEEEAAAAAGVEEEKDPDLKYALGSMAEFHQQADKDPEKRRLTKQMKFQEMMKIKKRATAAGEGKKAEENAINTEIVVRDHMHKYRRKAVYELFVRQFLQVGRKCLEFENHKFVPIYVRQARRLADLLREDHFELDAHELHELIRELEVLQKHPEVKRSQSTVGRGVGGGSSSSSGQRGERQKKKKEQPSPQLKPLEVWRPPVSEPSSPNQIISPIAFYPMSPEFSEARKSILKTGGGGGQSPAVGRRKQPQQQHQQQNGAHDLSIKVDIHGQSGTTPIFLSKAPTTAITFNGTAGDGDDSGRDYTKITAIEMTDKGGIDHHRRNHMTRITAQLDGGQDMHVSIL